jgi:hypothetical protein
MYPSHGYAPHGLWDACVRYPQIGGLKHPAAGCGPQTRSAEWRA